MLSESYAKAADGPPPLAPVAVTAPTPASLASATLSPVADAAALHRYASFEEADGAAHADDTSTTLADDDAAPESGGAASGAEEEVEEAPERMLEAVAEDEAEARQSVYADGLDTLHGLCLFCVWAERNAAEEGAARQAVADAASEGQRDVYWASILHERHTRQHVRLFKVGAAACDAVRDAEEAARTALHDAFAVQHRAARAAGRHRPSEELRARSARAQSARAEPAGVAAEWAELSVRPLSREGPLTHPRNGVKLYVRCPFRYNTDCCFYAEDTVGLDKQHLEDVHFHGRETAPPSTASYHLATCARSTRLHWLLGRFRQSAPQVLSYADFRFPVARQSGKPQLKKFDVSSNAIRRFGDFAHCGAVKFGRHGRCAFLHDQSAFVLGVADGRLWVVLSQNPEVAVSVCDDGIVVPPEQTPDHFDMWRVEGKYPLKNHSEPVHRPVYPRKKRRRKKDAGAVRSADPLDVLQTQIESQVVDVFGKALLPQPPSVSPFLQRPRVIKSEKTQKKYDRSSFFKRIDA